MEQFTEELSKLRSRQPNQLPQNTRQRLDKTYQMIMEQDTGKTNHQRGAVINMKMVKRLGLTAAATFVLGGAVIGSGFVSPAMAATLENLPLIGGIFKSEDPSLRLAAEKGLLSTPNESVTHDGITLKVSEAYYDGNRLSVSIIREGVELQDVMMPWRTIDKSEKVKGYIDWRSSMEAIVDGKPVSGLAIDSGEVPNQKNAFIFNVRKGLEEANLPDQFELTLVAKVTQVDEPFELKVPITKVQPTLSVQPEKTMNKGDFSYTVKQVQLTPGSTKVVIDSKGTVPVTEKQTGEYAASKMYFDIVDDNGNPIEQILLPFYQEAPKDQYHDEELYSPFKTTPKSITVKPYTYTVKKSDWTVVGEKEKTYHEDLEMTIQLSNK
ncbi:DUF4179 domain-containing protein [Shouchella clausii]